MPTLADIRQQYPQYNDLPDADLAQKLHDKFYSDMPFPEFAAKVGYSASAPASPPPDPSIPGGPADPARSYKPAPVPSALSHIFNAAAGAFAGPYGPSDETVAPFVGNIPVLSEANRAVLQGGGAVLDALGRPFAAAVKGGSAAVSEASKLAGNKDPQGLERDLNTLGDVALLETARAPAIPKVSTNAGGAVKSAAAAAKDAATAPLAKGLNWFWDVDKFAKKNPETIDLMDKAEAQGAKFPIGAWAPGAPFWSRMLQIAKGWNIDPVKEAATPFYEGAAGKVMEEAKLPNATGAGLTSATSAVPLAPAGEAVVARATASIDAATAALESKVSGYRSTTLDPAKERLRERARDISGEQQSLIADAEKARAQAGKATQEGFDAISKTMDDALKADEAQSGALMKSAEQQMRTLRRSVGAYFSKLYGAADEAAAGETPNVEGLAPWARQLLDGLLQPVKDQFPREIKALTSLASKEEQAPKPIQTGILDASGKPIVRVTDAAAAEPVTFGQLHELRSWVRHSIDWDDLAAGPSQGARKLLETKIDEILHDQEATPGLRAAADMLDEADAQYAKVIPKFKDPVVRQIINSGSAAAPDNAAKLASMVITENNTSRIGMVRDMVGPDIWKKVLAADLRSIVAHSLDDSGKFNMQAFARKIMERSNLGMLEPAYGGPEAAALTTQAKRIQQTYGKFDMDVLPGDTVTTLMQRAENAEARAAALAEHDPIGVLENLTKQVDARVAAMRAEGKNAIKADILSDLVGLPAEKAADKIFKTPDLFRAVVKRFGDNSTEVLMLRDAWIRKFMQRPIEATAKMAEEFGENTDEIQRILYPGTSLDDMTRLTKQMKLMFPHTQDATALGMAGMGMLSNPAHASFFPHIVKSVLVTFPTGVARGVASLALTKIAETLTDPAFRRFVMGGMKGTPIQQDASRVAVYYVMAGAPPQVALAAGAAVLFNQLTEPVPEEASPPKRAPWRQRMRQMPAPRKGWRDRMQQQGASP